MEMKPEPVQTKSKPARRAAISKDLAIQVFRRDGWICHWCGRPVIFGPALRYLAQFAKNSGFNELAYYHPHWTRRDAPLLDYMGAVLDHVKAHRDGGKSDIDNLVTACCKCNALKSDAKFQVFQAKLQRHNVKGKYGEPEHWDGLSTLFMVLIEGNRRMVTSTERDWLRALRGNARAATHI
jgi:5-methylcytosine-specific restriction endonuclease McrA